MSKCACCREEFNELRNYKGYKVCSACYIGYVNKVKVCENNSKYETEIDQLKQQLAEKENMHLLDEKEFQHYCAYKHIEPEIKGCLDREREYEKQLVEKDKEIERLKDFEKAYYYNQLQTSPEDIQKFQQLANQSAVNINYIAIQELEKVKNYFIEECEDGDGIKTEDRVIKKDIYEVADFIENQIKELKGNNDEPRQSN